MGWHSRNQGSIKGPVRERLSMCSFSGGELAMPSGGQRQTLWRSAGGRDPPEIHLFRGAEVAHEVDHRPSRDRVVK